MRYIGVDLGGTNIKAALVSETGNILMERTRPTNLPQPAQGVCDAISAVVHEVMAAGCVQASDIGAIDVGCPGTVDAANGVVRYSNNLNWHNFVMRGLCRWSNGF